MLKVLKVLNLTFLEKNVIMSWEKEWIIVRLDSFDRMTRLQYFSSAIVGSINDRRIVKINNLTKSPLVFMRRSSF